MCRGELISQAVSRHFGGPAESGKCFGNPPHHLKLNGGVVTASIGLKIEVRADICHGVPYIKLQPLGWKDAKDIG